MIAAAGSEMIAAWDGGSRRVWSLWELMFVIDAARLLAVSNWLTTLSHVMRDGSNVTVNLHTIQSLRSDIAHLRNEFGELDMGASEISADRLDKGLEKVEQQARQAPAVLRGDDLASMHRLYGEVTLRATDQMKARLVLVIRSDRKRFYEQSVRCLGDDVGEKFQSAAYEIDEAAKKRPCDVSGGAAAVKPPLRSVRIGPPCRAQHPAYVERMENETEIEKLARMIKSESDSVRGEMRDGFADVEKKFAEVRADMTTGFDAVNKHMAVLDQKIDHVDAKLDTHRQETKDGFAVVHRAIGSLSATLVDHEERVKVLEGE